MGFWSTLGKIGAVAGPIAAMPFTGGLSAGLLGAAGGIGSKVLSGIGQGSNVLSALGGVAGGAAKGSADQRMSESELAMRMAQLQQGGARDQFSADLAGANAQFGAGMQGAQFGREGQDRERKQAILSSLLGGMQDVKHTPGNPRIAAAMSQNTGGARPSALTHNKEALMALLAQPQIQAPTYNAATPYQAPTLPGMPTAGKGENILGGIGMGSSILGALGGLMKPKPKVVA